MEKNAYSIDGKSQSSFFKGELIETKKLSENSWRLKGIRNWAVVLEVDKIEKCISIIEKSAKKSDSFSRKGIAYEFSKLKTDNDINLFAQKYGLLGIEIPDHLYFQMEFKKTFNTSIYFALKRGFSYFEPLEIWKFYIDQIRKLLKLYKTLVNIHYGTEENKIEGNLLNIGIKIDDEENEPKYMVEWWDGTPTEAVILSDTAEKGDFLEIAREVLISSISFQANETMTNIAVDIIETNKPPLGFYVQESKVTNHLINAIYYDLWDLISKNEPVYICENPKCKLPFPKVKRQKYCCDACKSDAYRQRKITAATMYSEGYTVEQIANALNVKPDSVKRWTNNGIMQTEKHGS